MCAIFIPNKNNDELVPISSEKELKEIYEGNSNNALSFSKMLLTAPWSFIYQLSNSNIYYNQDISDAITTPDINIAPDFSMSTGKAESASPSLPTTGNKDYSTTNIQVENVDEADIIKTDGDYIYSISENNVVISDVRDEQNVKIASKIAIDSSIPEELILNDNILVVISSVVNNNNLWYYNNTSNNTTVTLYDITNKENPVRLKSYTLYEPYYTSRCINNKLYVISYGRLRKENNEIARYYTENFGNKEIPLENIKYLTGVNTRNQTLISMVDLKNPYADVSVNSYLIDIENAYVSENNIYLLDAKYKYNNDSPSPFIIFGLKGIFEIKDFFDNSDYSYDQTTSIYKFNIVDNGTIDYACKGEAKGRTINQYSVDEYNGYLRIALYDNDGSRVVVLDKDLKEVGKTPDLARGENMYSSRFIGNRAYLVTYRTMDPLYAIDLTYPTHPTVLGELKIPGYSTYLHPYDENHLIGIGMETEEHVNRDYTGKVISTSASVVGMKMALFDVSNVSSPKQISSTVIGDSRTTSAILTNAKALLFSKEKNLIAIPVNNYAENFESKDSENMSTIINNYVNNTKSYISEGYLVYDISPENGFSLKGNITHDVQKSNYNSYYVRTKLLRGLYIEDKLYTVSESMIKINNLSNLELVNEIKLTEGGN